MKLPTLRKRAEKPANEKPGAPRRRRGPKRGCLIFSVLFLALIGFMVYRSRTREKPHAEVEIAQAKSADVREIVSATGKLQPFTTVDVKSKAGGKVLKMAVEEGTLVKRGQLICLIDRQDTDNAFKQAQADLDAARSSLRQAAQNSRLQQASVGPQIDQSAASLAAARARLKQANETLALEANSNPAQVAQSAAGVKAARASLESARQTLELQKRTVQTAIDEANSGIKAAQARLDQSVLQAKNQPALSQAAIEQSQAAANAAQSSVASAEEALGLLTDSTQPQETVTAKAGVTDAKSQLEVAQTNLERQENLLAKGYVAQTIVDDARDRVVLARSALQTAQTRFDTLDAAQAAARRDQQARVAASKSSLAQARASLQSARLGVVQDTLADKDVVSSRAALEQAQAALRTAQANQRQIGLRQSEIVSARAALQQAEASLTSTQAGTRQVKVRAADVDAARAAVQQADAVLSASQASRIQNSVREEDVEQARARLVRAESTLKNARENRAETTVTAPRDGIILQKYVDLGSIIQSGQSGASGGTSIVQLANVSRMYVDVKVDEADIAKVQTGQKVNIILDAYPDATRKGAVRKIYPLAVAENNVTSVRVQVEVDPKNVSGKLRPQMNATCDFIVNDRPAVISVPVEAVRDKGEKSVVTVIKNPKKPLWEKSNQVEREVKVGVRGDEFTQIVSGLKVGETVVTKVTEPEGATPSGGFGGRGKR